MTRCELIPVIDIRNGITVHARRGQRDRYAPIVTPLAASADPLDVVAGLLSVSVAGKLYIADLDAILGNGDNADVVDTIAHHHPGLDLWVDCGHASEAAIETWLSKDRGPILIGSESQGSIDLLARYGKLPDTVLSLDFKDDRFLGPPEILRRSDLWPERVIVMTLARVGSGQGPDLERLRTMRSIAGPNRSLFAAGGVRDGGDVTRLAEEGISGVLVASALHEGRLSAPPPGTN